MKSFILNVRAQKLLKPSIARRGMPSLPIGTIVYVIPFANGKYFTYGYSNRETANRVRKRLEKIDLYFNSTSEVRVIANYKPEEI